MQAEIKFIVPGQPVPQGRPRFARRGSQIQTYDPKPSVEYKKLVKEVAILNKPEELLEGSLSVEIQIYRQMLKSFSRAKREQAEYRQLRPVTKPDIDNYAKGILDALKGVIWIDDGQVVRLVCDKFYSAKPRIEIAIKQF